MSVIIIGADYFGGAIQSIRQRNDVSATKLAHLFDCDIGQLHRYEKGVDLIPRDVLRRVFIHAAKMDGAPNA